MTSTTWEYHVEDAAGFMDKSLPQLLADLGREGWELVHFGANKQAIFKRPVAPATPVAPLYLDAKE